MVANGLQVGKVPAHRAAYMTGGLRGPMQQNNNKPVRMGSGWAQMGRVETPRTLHQERNKTQQRTCLHTSVADDFRLKLGE